ncbi:RNA pol II accessory factor, Cdc73 family-domain-containing protein [Filobasidium floriforme]|uniref:RNA pol II accessory factor, Cdc73 family-domain-containing protein n=1 Tax=Filobasidium floriforme TaxID=5210 RepID=UPI001E8D1AE0|nr:RNA pol II accessory factor, Cdc73 family-domain-containing protein [Filobasidium floriforme]KAH8082234.1 RNA pol II accessory factor, Cdc73 family-domain-containing protein [Filobasidium floriforme]
MADATEDPLVLLRSSIASSSNPPVLTDSSGQPTTQALDATNVALSSSSGSSITLPITTPTRLTSQANDASNLLTLQQLLYTYLEKDSGNADYMRKAAAGVGAGFRPVGILDRRIVLEYLLGGEAPAGRVLALGSKPEDKHFEGSQAPTTATVDTGGASRPSAVGGSTVPSKRRYVPDEADKAFYKKLQSLTEKPHVDIYDPLRHVPPGKKADFSTLRSNIYEERIKPLRESVNRAKEGKPMEPDNQANKGERDAPRGVKKQRSMQQNIIMLSSSPTALVTMWNVKKLLEEGEFERNEDAKTRQQKEGNRKMEDVVMIYRTVSMPNGEEKKIKYYAIDSVDVLHKLGSAAGGDPWDRVLCVFTTGQAWQFKSYKWSEPKDLFRNVLGIYFHLSTEPQHPATKDWNVKLFKIDPKHRHTDRPVVSAFWQTLEKASRRG